MSMHINLLDITEEGHTFEYKRGDEVDLDAVVDTIIGGVNDFNVKVHLAEAGDIYMATGEFTLDHDDECSLCAEDINTPVKAKFNEYLMKADEREAKGHAPHNGLNLDSQQEVTFVEGYDLDMADFIREQFAIAIPPYPKCLDKAACEARQKENAKHYEAQKMTGHPAFSVLDQLKKKQ